MIIDSHVHVDALSAACEAWVHTQGRAGTYRALVPAVAPPQWEAALMQWRDTPYLDLCAGVHPWCFSTEGAFGGPLASDWQPRLEAAVAGGGVRVIGEIGLDAVRLRTAAAQDAAEAAFVWQLALAKSSGLPVVLHSVRSHARCVALLRAAGWSASDSGIVHGFVGSIEEVRAYQRVGVIVGIGPRMLDSAKGRGVAAQVETGGWVLETDAPYLGGSWSAQGAASIVSVGEAVATIRGCLAPRVWAENASTYGRVMGGLEGPSNR